MEPSLEGHDAASLPAVEIASPPPLDRPLGAGQALLVFLAFFATQILIGLVCAIVVTIVYVALHGADDPHLAQSIEPLATLPASFLGEIGGGAAAFLLTWMMLPAPRRAGALRPIGWKRASRPELLWATLAGLALSFVYLFGLLSLAAAPVREEWGPLVTAAMSGGWRRHVWAALLLLIAPAVEEFVFRGVLFSGLRSSSLGTIGAGALVTALFVAAHLPEVQTFGPAILALTLLAAATLVARLKTQSLVPAIAVHTAYNFGVVLATYLYS